MSVDVSAARAKERAARYATSFDNTSTGPAGYADTKKAPVSLTDKQVRTLDQFSELVPKERRAASVRQSWHGFPVHPEMQPCTRLPSTPAPA